MFVILAFLLSAILCVPNVVAQDSSKGSYHDAIEWFRALYPDLKGRPVALDFFAQSNLEWDVFPSVFDLSISEALPLSPTEKQISEADRIGHLTTRFTFHGTSQRILSVSASGSFVSSDKADEVNKLVETHPEWNEAKMTEALVSVGAKFGPDQKEKILEKFSALGLEPLVGKIHITSVEFIFRGNHEAPFFSIMHWTIHFEGTRVGHRDVYFVAMEPFGGRVTSLGRLSTN